MSVAKSRLKAAILEDIGCTADDMREGAMRSLHMAQGSATFGKLIVEKLRGLHEHVQKDVDEEKCTQDEATLRAKEITRCVNFVQHLSEGLQTEVIQAKGRVHQSEDFVKVLKKQHDAEVSKVAAIELALMVGTVEAEDGQPTQIDPSAHRPTGVRPGSRLKHRRQAEAQGAAQVPPTEPAPPKAKTAKAASKPKKKAATKKALRANGVTRGTAARSGRGRRAN